MNKIEAKLEKMTADDWLDCDYESNCPVRELLDKIGSTWSVLVIIQLGKGTRRFSELRRAIDKLAHISQKMLTQTLRTLERDGLVKRTVFPTSPPAVEYELTELGRSLLGPIRELTVWAFESQPRIEEARRAYDERMEAMI
jgi:DNA-binding HxlR family transcriptional regulator